MGIGKFNVDNSDDYSINIHRYVYKRLWVFDIGANNRSGYTYLRWKPRGSWENGICWRHHFETYLTWIHKVIYTDDECGYVVTIW